MDRRIPDAREEAAQFEKKLGNCCGDVIHAYDDDVAELIRDIQYRTLMGAQMELRKANRVSHGCAKYCGCTDCWLGRLALSVKEGK